MPRLAADEPAAWPLRNRQRRLPLRTVHLHLRTDPLERALRLAAYVRRGAARDVPFLARGRAPHGHSRHPRRLRRIRALQHRIRGAALSLYRGQQAGRCCHGRAVRKLVSSDLAPAGPSRHLRAARECLDRRVWVPASVLFHAPAGSGRLAVTRSVAALDAGPPAPAPAYRDEASQLSARLSDRGAWTVRESRLDRSSRRPALTSLARDTVHGFLNAFFGRLASPTGFEPVLPP